MSEFFRSKLYIAFKGKSNICDIVIRKKFLIVFINLKEGALIDPEGKMEMIKGLGHWGNGDYRINVDNSDSFDYLMTLIRQSYKENI